jgi:hypothetical protein
VEEDEVVVVGEGGRSGGERQRQLEESEVRKGERNPSNEGVDGGMLILQMRLKRLLEALQLQSFPHFAHGGVDGETAGVSLTRPFTATPTVARRCLIMT